MTDQQLAIIAPEEKCHAVIRQARLHVDVHEILSIEFLNAVGKTNPAKVIIVKFNITHGALQQTLIYVIIESVIPVNGLCTQRVFKNNRLQ